MITTLEDRDTDLKLDDLYLCAYLACKGVRPQAVERTMRGRKYFVYEGDDRDRAYELAEEFHAGNVNVNLHLLRGYVKDLKEVMCRERG